MFADSTSRRDSNRPRRIVRNIARPTMQQSSLQHYVPRFLLRKFGLGKKDRVHVFDKHKKSSFVSSAKAVAAEYGLYDFSFMGEELTLEPGLAKLESVAARIFAAVESRRWLPTPNSEDRGHMAGFLAVQLVRTRAQMNLQKDLRQRMETYLRSQGMDESFFAPDPEVGEGENAERANFARQIVNAPKEYAPALLEKDWMLLQTRRKHPFLIGDHPLVMHNMRDTGLRGNRGLMVEGIEIYLPISPTLTLALICPTRGVELRRGMDTYVRVQTRPDAHLRFGDSVAEARRILDAIDGGPPLACQPENVVFHNSLQIAEAERFIFSMTGDFDLAKDMLRTNPELRIGQRLSEMTGKF